MCPREMRNPAPAWLKGLGTEYLGGGISAVSAQHTELQLHKSWSMKTIMNTLRLSTACGRLTYLQLLIIEVEISPHLTQREHWHVPLHTGRPLKRWRADRMTVTRSPDGKVAVSIFYILTSDTSQGQQLTHLLHPSLHETFIVQLMCRSIEGNDSFNVRHNCVISERSQSHSPFCSWGNGFEYFKANICPYYHGL